MGSPIKKHQWNFIFGLVAEVKEFLAADRRRAVVVEKNFPTTVWSLSVRIDCDENISNIFEQIMVPNWRPFFCNRRENQKTIGMRHVSNFTLSKVESGKLVICSLPTASEPEADVVRQLLQLHVIGVVFDLTIRVVALRPYKLVVAFCFQRLPR